MAKRKKKHVDLFADVKIKLAAEAFGGISSLTPSAGSQHGGSVPIELTGFLAVIPNISNVYSFLVKAVVTPASGGLPAAFVQNVTTLRSGFSTQFTIVTVHLNPPAGNYHLKATIEAQVINSGSPVLLDVKEWDYTVS